MTRLKASGRAASTTTGGSISRLKATPTRSSTSLLTPNNLSRIPMSSSDDNEEPELDCPECGRGFSTFARLDDHMARHEGLPRCRTCGETKQGHYHRCR